MGLDAESSISAQIGLSPPRGKRTREVSGKHAERSHPLKNQTPKGCATQFKSLPHPPAISTRSEKSKTPHAKSAYGAPGTSAVLPLVRFSTPFVHSFPG